MLKTINFIWKYSRNYKDVQSSIFGQIGEHLPEERQRSTKERIITNKETINLSLFIRNRADVLMSHGVADKNYLFIRDDSGDFMINKFPHVLVPGQWLKDRLLSTEGIRLVNGQIHVVGWPRLDKLLELRRLNRKNRLMRLRDRVTRRKKNVLWAPTHDVVDDNVRKDGLENVTASSYPGLNEHVPHLEQAFDFHVALHPRNKAVTDKTSTTDKLAKADVVISDFGTMVYEAWGLGIPVIFPRWLVKDRVIELTPGSAEAYIYTHRIGLHADSFEELCDMARKNVALGDDVKAFMEQYLPEEYRGCAGQRVASLLSRLRK